MGRILSSLALSALAVVVSGCAVVAPAYTPSIDNVQALKGSGAGKARVGAFNAMQGTANPNPIPLRANTMRSPYGGTFSAYLSEAITRELTMAGKLAPDSDIEITGTLLKNQVDPAISTGTGTIEARFVVKKGGAVRYDRVKSAQREWESSFAAAIAIPRAVQEYSISVQTLLANLYADPDFINALK